MPAMLFVCDDTAVFVKSSRTMIDVVSRLTVSEVKSQNVPGLPNVSPLGSVTVAVSRMPLGAVSLPQPHQRAASNIDVSRATLVRMHSSGLDRRWPTDTKRISGPTVHARMSYELMTGTDASTAGVDTVHVFAYIGKMTAADSPTAPKHRGRIDSIDAVRGLIMIIMA